MKAFANKAQRAAARSYLAAAAVFVISLLFGLLIERLHSDQIAVDQRAEATRHATMNTQVLQHQFSRAVAAAHAITVVLQQYGHIDDFEQLAAGLLATAPSISSMSLAPGGVISQTYPAVSHNIAIGLDLLSPTYPGRHAVEAAIDQRRAMFTEPMMLAVGERGTIVRLPVYLTQDGEDLFWGIVSQVSTLASIESASGLPALRGMGYDYAVYDSAEPPQLLLGNAEILADEPLLYTMRLPMGDWSLALVPLVGWGQNELYLPELALILIISALLAGIIVVRGRENALLSREVATRSAELQAANVSIERENSERRIVEQGLQQGEDHWRGLLEHIPHMLLIYDRGGRILDANHRACATLGFSHAQLLARFITDIDVSQRARSLLEQWAQFKPGQPMTSRGEYRRMDARSFPVEVRTGSIDTDDGRLMIALARDLTTQMAAEQALEAANLELEHQVNERTAELRRNIDELREESSDRQRTERQMALTSEQSLQAYRTRSRFLDSITDGIRAPMEEVLGPLADLAGSTFDGEAQQLAQHAHHSAKRLERLITELLDFSHLESGTLAIQPQEVALYYLIHDITTTYATLARSKQLAFDCVIDPVTPAMLRIDPIRIRQILDNLLGNAVKFTAQGGIALDVTTAPRGDRRMTLIFRVTDTGIGIPPEARTRIFEPFTQADGSVTRRYGGTGLGLTISYQLARALGGQLELEERSEPGTCMRLEIEAEPISTAGRLPAPLSRAIADRELLLVVDDVCMQGHLARLLADFGLSVALRHGGEPLGELSRWPLILTDSNTLSTVEIARAAAATTVMLLLGEAEAPPPLPDAVLLLRHPLYRDDLERNLARAFGSPESAP